MISLRINGIKQFRRFKLNSLSISAQVGQRGTASFSLVDKSGLLQVALGSPVVIEDLYNDEPGALYDTFRYDTKLWGQGGQSRVLFAGTIEQITDTAQQQIGVNPTTSLYDGMLYDSAPLDSTPAMLHVRELKCAAVDNSALADRVVVESATYTSKTCGNIVSLLVAIYLPGVALGTITAGPVQAQFDASYLTLAQVLDNLATLAGCIWYIDYNRTLWFHSLGQRPAPFSVYDGTRNFKLLSVGRDRTQFRNKQYLRLDDGTYTAPASDTASIASVGVFASIDGVSGISATAAPALAAALLAKYRADTLTPSYETDYLGVQPGQSQRLSFPSMGVNNTFLVESVSTVAIGLDTETVRYRSQVRCTNGQPAGDFVQFFQRYLRPNG